MNKQVITEKRKLDLLRRVFESVLKETYKLTPNGYEFLSPQLQTTRKEVEKVQNSEQAVELLKKFIEDNKGDYTKVEVHMFNSRSVTPEQAYQEIKQLYDNQLEYKLKNISTNVEYNKWKNLFAVSPSFEATSDASSQAVRDTGPLD